MNTIHRCFQKISPGNHFSTYWSGRTGHTYVRTYGRTDKGDAICPPIINGWGIKSIFFSAVKNNMSC